MSEQKIQPKGEIEDHFLKTQYAFVHMLTEHLVDCRRVFDGDLDAMVVLAILGQNHLTVLIAAETDGEARSPSLGMTASRIADVTEMSRQTVRRKLQDLEKQGWITQQADASWRLAGPPDDTQAGRDLAELSKRGLARATRLQDDLNRILGVRNSR